MGSDARHRLCNQSQPVPLRCLASQSDCQCQKCYFLSLFGCRLHLTSPMLVHCVSVEPAALVSGAVPCHTRPHHVFSAFALRATTSPDSSQHATLPIFILTLISRQQKLPYVTSLTSISAIAPQRQIQRCSASPIEPFSDSS
ncbi:hypothetical protein TRVL_08426 [Trypanosoma vivax]|nr:hypothetical protein TRVL_08426 [Trypanosoma vivax]